MITKEYIDSLRIVFSDYSKTTIITKDMSFFDVTKNFLVWFNNQSTEYKTPYTDLSQIPLIVRSYLTNLK